MNALLYFWNRMSKYVKSVATYFQLQTKMRTPHNFKCKKVTELNIITTQNGYHVSWQSLDKKLI